MTPASVSPRSSQIHRKMEKQRNHSFWRGVKSFMCLVTVWRDGIVDMSIELLGSKVVKGLAIASCFRISRKLSPLAPSRGLVPSWNNDALTHLFFRFFWWGKGTLNGKQERKGMEDKAGNVLCWLRAICEGISQGNDSTLSGHHLILFGGFEAILWEKTLKVSQSYSNGITSYFLSHFLKLYKLNKIVQIIFKCKTTHNTPVSLIWAAVQSSPRLPFSHSRAKTWAPWLTGSLTIASRRKNGRSG